MQTNFDRETRKVLAIAMLTTLATGLVQWGLEELKRFTASRRKRVETEKPNETDE
jgi:hypothetical protein